MHERRKKYNHKVETKGVEQKQERLATSTTATVTAPSITHKYQHYDNTACHLKRKKGEPLTYRTINAQGAKSNWDWVRKKPENARFIFFASLVDGGCAPSPLNMAGSRSFAVLMALFIDLQSLGGHQTQCKIASMYLSLEPLLLSPDRRC
jgi:hypothetical protein